MDGEWWHPILLCVHRKTTSAKGENEMLKKVLIVAIFAVIGIGAGVSVASAAASCCPSGTILSQDGLACLDGNKVNVAKPSSTYCPMN